jgi:hypothetical protein
MFQKPAKILIAQKQSTYLKKSSFSSGNLLAPCPIFYDDFLKEYDKLYIESEDDISQVKLAVIAAREPIIGEKVMSSSGLFGIYKELEGYKVLQREIHGRKMYYFYDKKKHFPYVGLISPMNSILRDYLKSNSIHDMSDILINSSSKLKIVSKPIVDLIKIH